MHDGSQPQTSAMSMGSLVSTVEQNNHRFNDAPHDAVADEAKHSLSIQIARWQKLTWMNS
jgi:hypothetical protein